jgi:hypothetical protein
MSLKFSNAMALRWLDTARTSPKGQVPCEPKSDLERIGLCAPDRPGHHRCDAGSLAA